MEAFLYQKYKDVYYLFYYDIYKRSRRSISTGTNNLREARKFQEEFLEKLKFSRELKSITFSEFGKLFLSTIDYSSSSLKNFKYLFGDFLKYNQDKFLEHYTLLEIDKYVKIKLNVSPHTAHNARRFLRLVFNKAVAWNYLKENIVLRSSRIRLPESDPVVFSKEDFAKLMSAVTLKKYKDIFLFAVLSGLRLNELLHLKVSDVDLERGWIKVVSDKYHRTKTGKTRYVELHSKLREIVAENAGRKYFFNQLDQNKIRLAMDRYLKKAGLPKHYNFKALRSTFGKWLLDEGINLKYISQQLGHQSIVTTEKHYAKYITSEIKGWVDKIGV